MDEHALALVAAGALGSAVALVRGVLTQRHLVDPLMRMAGGDRRMRASTVRLVPVLLQFSTYAWFLGGLALIAAALWLEPKARLVVCAMVGAIYIFGTLGNLWATRGRHPGWMLLGASTVLIAFGASTLQI
ncbi:MAG: hypothetical protein ACREHE_11840 [Rhizomicrobium sp.]